ncbi:XerC Integrase [uncultured Caudovirales phage]|uniref:Integrase n=1 Tax=uncultured Caudovirales phage TaxID=2100421 RepID=A0A6J5NHC9_9CAUD|nr:XerC Integrase [uncultured Caudovirales phage]
MPSIIQLNGKWRAQVRRAGHKTITKTHATKAEASAWARRIETQLDQGKPVTSAVTVGALIACYRELRAVARPIKDTSNEHYMLKTLERILGDQDAMTLGPKDLVAFAQRRKDEGAGPYTTNMDISKLGTVLRFTASAKGLTLPDSVGIARPLLKHLGMIGGGGKRERRLEEDELSRIVEFMAAGRGQRYADTVLFAVATAMRLGEICELAWADVDAERKLALIRNRKDPRNKAGNDQWIPLLPAAWEVLQRQPDGERPFPLRAGTVSKYFTEACKSLSIPDLHFHDLRHEGTSQLFESGFSIEQVALVTGHKKWENLRRYTQLRPEDLHGQDGRTASK